MIASMLSPRRLMRSPSEIGGIDAARISDEGAAQTSRRWDCSKERFAATFVNPSGMRTMLADASFCAGLLLLVTDH